MTFTKVEKVPNHNGKHNLIGFLEQFMAENIKCAKVNFNEHDYKRSEYLQSALCYAIKRDKLPITTARRGEDVYLVRTDM